MTREERIKIRIGEKLAETLQLKEVAGFYSGKRYKTTWGTKTALGLYEIVKRIMEGE